MKPFRLRSPRPAPQRENDVEKACLDALRYRHILPIRLNVGKFKTWDDRWLTIGEKGIPDYVIPAWFLEIKRPGGELSDIQREKIAVLRDHWGIETAVIESVDELIEWLAIHHIKF